MAISMVVKMKEDVGGLREGSSYLASMDEATGFLNVTLGDTLYHLTDDEADIWGEPTAAYEPRQFPDPSKVRVMFDIDIFRNAAKMSRDNSEHVFSSVTLEELETELKEGTRKLCAMLLDKLKKDPEYEGTMTSKRRNYTIRLEWFDETCAELAIDVSPPFNGGMIVDSSLEDMVELLGT